MLVICRDARLLDYVSASHTPDLRVENSVINAFLLNKVIYFTHVQVRHLLGRDSLDLLFQLAVFNPASQRNRLCKWLFNSPARMEVKETLRKGRLCSSTECLCGNFLLVAI